MVVAWIFSFFILISTCVIIVTKRDTSCSDYITINRRVNKLDIKINERIGNNIFPEIKMM
jgi:hypothetical protein